MRNAFTLNPLSRAAAIGGLALLLSGPTHAATIANIGGDYAGLVAPPAGWQYLRSTAANGGTEVALVGSSPVGNAGNGGFSQNSTLGLAGLIGEAQAGLEYEIFGDGFGGATGPGNQGVVGTDLIVHPGHPALNSDPFVIMRRTISPADLAGGSQASIVGSFRNLIRRGADGPSNDSVVVSIYKNASLLFTANGNDPLGSDGDRGMLSQADGTFNLNTLLAVGDTIDFVVGVGTNISADETALRGTISVVPEPATALLGALSVLGIVAARRRRD